MTEALPSTPPPVTAVRVAAIWLPTAISTGVLMAEIPAIYALVARAGDATVSLAALGLALSVIQLVNSPGVALAPVTAALSRTSTSTLLARYSSLVAAVLTGVLLLLVATPVGQWIMRSLLSAPADIEALLRDSLWCLLPAPALVCLRRHAQGVLIARADTAIIGVATMARLVSSIALAASAVAATSWPGAIVGALALTCGAFVEGVIVAARAARGRAAPQSDEGAVHDQRQLARFHVPLAGTMALAMLPQPLIAAAIARADDPAIALAAWPVVYGLVWLVAGCTVDVESISSAHSESDDSRRAVATFTLSLGAALLVAMAVLTLSPLAELYFAAFSGLDHASTDAALDAAPLLIAVPACYALRGWMRGHLIARRHTADVQRAMAYSVATLAGLLLVVVALHDLDFLEASVGAFAAATLVEIGALARAAPRWSADPLSTRAHP